MKPSVFHWLIFSTFVLLTSGCKDKDNKNGPVIITRFFQVKKIDCESNVALCNTGRTGLKFTALAPMVKDNRPNWNLELRVRFEPDPYTLTVCCDTIPRLIDSLKMMHEALEKMRKDKPDKEERTCNDLPDGIMINIYYAKNFVGTGEHSCLEFGKPADGSVFYVYTKEEFDKLIKDMEERFGTCCLE